MDAVLTVAIAKALKTKEVSAASNELDAGTYTIDELVRVQGTVTKGDDYDQVIHMKVPLWEIVAVLLSKVNGATMDAVVKEAVSMPKEKVTEIKSKAQASIDKIKAPANSICAGKVTTNLTVAPETVIEAVKEAVEGEPEIV